MSTRQSPGNDTAGALHDVKAGEVSVDDIATCEYCGATDARHKFYSTSKRFCSATCSHSFSAWHRNKKPTGALPGKVKKFGSKTKSQILRLPTEMERQQSIGFDWGSYIDKEQGHAAGVHHFLHAPMSSCWGEVTPGMKVEVLNLDCNLSTKVFWIAEAVQVEGYKAKLRYEGFADDSSCDFWCNLCTLDVHAVGWCATIGKPLVPPQTIQYKYTNWKSFLVKRLTGAKTLPNDFHKRVVESMECPFQCGMRLEVVDKTQISRMRIGIIEDIVGGRFHLRYEDSDDVHDDFWCHAQSPLIHWVGWCEKVGHRILVASKDYKTKKGFRNARQELFAPLKQVKTCGFKAGMKLEAIDPLNLSAVCVATVKKVLKSGYLMIGIDGSEAANGSDWFCYHCSAPSIFPVGFCMANDIALTVPKGYKDTFSWPSYLKEKNSQAAPVELFDSDLPDHGFKPGMKLEAVDLMEPRLICVATVEKVVGRLLHVHFDGWEDEYDQWVDCQSPDIYPLGWCELVGYELQAPPNSQVVDTAGKKKKLKGRSFIVKKKKKKLQPAKKAAQQSTALEKVESRDERPSEKLEETYPAQESTTHHVESCQVTPGEEKSAPEITHPEPEKSDGVQPMEQEEKASEDTQTATDPTVTGENTEKEDDGGQEPVVQMTLDDNTEKRCKSPPVEPPSADKPPEEVEMAEPEKPAD